MLKGGRFGAVGVLLFAGRRDQLVESVRRLLDTCGDISKCDVICVVVVLIDFRSTWVIKIKFYEQV